MDQSAFRGAVVSVGEPSDMDRKLKILLVIENSCYGGGERTFSMLIRGLPPERFGLYCASLPSGRFYEETKDRCRFLPLDLTRRFRPGNIPLLRRLIADNGIDIVHSQGARADFYSALAASKTGAKAAATVAMPVDGFDVNFFRKRAYSVLAALAARRTAAAITVSKELRTRLEGRYPGVELIPNPVDLSMFDPGNFDATSVMDRFGLKGKLVLGALGRLEWQKGYPFLLSALKLLLAREPALSGKLVCLIAGSGSLEARLKELAEEEGIFSNVVFCGEVTEVRDFLGALDIFVMPSLLEGQPLALLEAMAMERPIVASDIPGISGTVTSGSTALLVTPGDAQALAGGLSKLIGDRAFALRLGRGARAAAGKSGLPAYLASHERFYQRLARGER